MAFPKTEAEFIAQGYEFSNSSTCNGCGADIEWWITPKGKKMPIDPGSMESHWGTCPKAQDFRKKK